MNYSLGIDLGSYNAVMAVVNSMGQVTVLNNKEGKRSTPSIIYFEKDKIIVGEEAKELQALGEENIASGFKRNIGNPYFKVKFNNKEYSSEHLTTLILRKLKKDAEISLNTNVNRVVVSVPAYFNNHQREATRNAAKKAGFNKVNIINETSATAIAYGLNALGGNKRVLIYDLGGGTFDVSLINIGARDIEILSTEGTTDLGGKEWDERLSLYLVHKFNEDHGIWLLDNLDSYRELSLKAEKLKKQLSIREKVSITLSYFGEKGTYTITRRDFERLTEDLLNRTMILSKKAIGNTNYTFKDIDEILIVGGSSRMPMIREGIERVFKKKPIVGINVKEAVAIGAAIQGSAHLPSKIKPLPMGKRLSAATAHSLGVISVNDEGNRFINKILITKNTKVPCTIRKSYIVETSKAANNYIEIYLLQGDNESPQKCTLIGKYIFYNIKYITSNGAVIDVEYSYDEEETITLKAVQRETGKILPLKIKTIEGDMGWLKQSMFIRR